MLTFFFTDIADSTRLWQDYPRAMGPALAAHDDILRRLIPEHQGHIVKTTGDGFHAVFEHVADAARAALAAQMGLRAYDWQQIPPLSVRMGLHTGDAEARDGDYFGTAVNKAARIMSLASGGQVLLSAVTAALLVEAAGAEFSGRFLGDHRLKGLAGKTGICQLLHPDLLDNFPPLKGGADVPHNLPAEMTSFVGREQEIDQIVNHLVDTEADPERRRLVTLIGPGGTGKTRLSLQAARTVRPAFVDGVWLVELAPLTDPAMVPAAVLQALNLDESPQVPVLNLITSYLRDRQALLIFDNCEHLIEASAGLIEQILQAAGLVQVLASSREALGIYGETVQRIQSLPLPPAEAARWDAIQASDAVQLFLARAEAAGAGRWLSAEHGPAIAQICRRLDGIPLALEMAAARLRVFSPAQILDRLDDRFRLLTGGSRTALPRLQTLQALIDWSYNLLDEDEKGLFQELSVFAGGWTLAMAEAVCPDWDVYTLLPGLVDKSLVVTEPQGDDMRYQFLETIRQYARDRLLESGRSAALRDRHLDYFNSYTMPDPVFNVATIEAQRRRVQPEMENCRAALTWALERDHRRALELVGNLADYWANGYVWEGTQWLDKALANFDQVPDLAAEVAGNQRLRLALARAYRARGALLFTAGHNEQSLVDAERSVELFAGFDDPVQQAMAYGLVGMAGISIGQNEPALAAIEIALTYCRRSPDPFVYAVGLNIKGLAMIYTVMDVAAARALLEEAIAIEPTIGTISISGVFALIKIEMLNHNWDRARELADLALRNIADSPYADNKRQLYMYQAERGHIERQSGNLALAANIYARLIVAYRELSMEPAVANLLECFAMIAGARGHFNRAGRLFGAAAALRQRIGADMTAYERVEYEASLAQLRAGVEPAALEANWQHGQALTIDRAIDLALKYAGDGAA